MHLYNNIPEGNVRSNMAYRVAWLDVARAIGIYAIYLGHFGEEAGPAYRFVFQFHVPLFFFLSGCAETYNKEEAVFGNLKRNVKTILLPAYFFAVLSLTRELKVLNIFKMYFLLCNKDLTKQIRTHGLLLKCKKILDIKSKICGRSRYRRFLEVARAAL